MRPKTPLAFLFVFLLPLLVLFQHPAFKGPVRETALSLFKPVLTAGRSVSDAAASLGEAAVQFWRTFRQQGADQERIAQLENRLRGLEEAERENARLKKLLDFRGSISAKSVPARVIGWDPSPWRKTVIIDKGRHHGVRKDMAVVVPEGLVGRVLEAGPMSSRVILLTDPDGRVSGVAETSRAQGVVGGDGTFILKMAYLELDSGIAVGETVLTSGIGIYPKGLRIGRILSLSKAATGLHLEARVEPSVHFSKLEEVLCLVSSPAN